MVDAQSENTPLSAPSESTIRHEYKADTPARIYLVDDHKGFLDALKGAFGMIEDYDVVLDANSYADAVRQIEEGQFDDASPNVLLFDGRLENNTSSVELVKLLIKKGVKLPIVVLTAEEEINLKEQYKTGEGQPIPFKHIPKGTSFDDTLAAIKEARDKFAEEYAA